MELLANVDEVMRKMRRVIENRRMAARVVLVAALVSSGTLARADTTEVPATSATRSTDPVTEGAPGPDTAPEPVQSDQSVDPSAIGGVEVPPAPAVPTPEQVRAAMEEAQQRRDDLMQPDPVVASPEVREAMRERWGVEVYGVRLAARGYMIDFRFRVLDVDKALPLFDSRIKPYLLTESTNVKLPVPVGEKVGAFRTTNRGKNITPNRDYYLMFGNPDAYAKPGQKVSVVIGDFRVEHLTLQ